MNNIDWPLADIVKKKEQQKKKEEEERHSTVNLSAQLFLDMPRPEGLSEVAETRVAAQRDPLPLVSTCFDCIILIFYQEPLKVIFIGDQGLRKYAMVMAI